MLVQLSMYGTVYQILSVLLVLSFLRDALELLILVSFKCVMTFKLVYYRAHVSAANVALLSCRPMYVLLCEFILITVQIKIHSFIHSFTHHLWQATSVRCGI